MLQQFYSESIKRAAGTEQTADGVPLWAVTHFELDPELAVSEPAVEEHVVATAEALWGYHGVELVQELLDRNQLSRQPDGTILKYGG